MLAFKIGDVCIVEPHLPSHVEWVLQLCEGESYYGCVQEFGVGHKNHSGHGSTAMGLLLNIADTLTESLQATIIAPIKNHR